MSRGVCLARSVARMPPGFDTGPSIASAGLQPLQQQPTTPATSAPLLSLGASSSPLSAAARPSAPSTCPPPPSLLSSLPLVAQLKQLLPSYLPERSDLAGLPSDDPLLSLVSSFSSLFQYHSTSYLQPVELCQFHRVSLSFPLLAQQCAPICPDFAAELHEKPTLVLAVLSAAAHHAVLTLRERRGGLYPGISAATRITARLLHHSPLLPFRSVSSRVWNRYVSFRCQVVKTGPTKPDLLALRFTCRQCGASVVRRLQEGRYAEPKATEVCGCLQQFSSGWRIDRTAVFQTDWQLVRVQEMVAGGRHYQHSHDDADSTVDTATSVSSSRSAHSSSSNGAVAPRFFECELRDDLVDQLIPGDILTVSGVLRHSEFEVFSRDRRERKKEWSLYMDVNAINVLSRKEDSQLLTWITFEDDEVARIVQLLRDTDGNPFKWSLRTHICKQPLTYIATTLTSHLAASQILTGSTPRTTQFTLCRLQHTLLHSPPIATLTICSPLRCRPLSPLSLLWSGWFIRCVPLSTVTSW